MRRWPTSADRSSYVLHAREWRAAGRQCLDGTDGPDKLVGTKYGDLVIAGSGEDTIRVEDLSSLARLWVIGISTGGRSA